MTEKQRLINMVSVLSEKECTYFLKWIEIDYPKFLNEVEELLEANAKLIIAVNNFKPSES
jgi:hypothetical protein